MSLEWDDGLIQEVFRPFLSAKALGDKVWHYKYKVMDEGDQVPSTRKVLPAEISVDQQVVLNKVLSDGFVDTHAKDLIDFLARNGLVMESFVALVW
jgi:hypothetical protein